MAQYPIKMLKDENGTPFVPLVAPEAVKDTQGTNWQTLIDRKLEKTNIIAGDNITLSVSGNNITINSQAGGATTNVIDNLNQSTGGVGVLDAHQGYVLKGMIPGVQNTLTSTSTTDALSAYQGYLLSNRIVPGGGTANQILAKNSATDNDLKWVSLASVATSGSYNDLSNKPAIPTNSSFTLSGLSEKSYNSLTNKPTIPVVNDVITATCNTSTTVTSSSTSWGHVVLPMSRIKTNTNTSLFSLTNAGYIHIAEAGTYLISGTANCDYVGNWSVVLSYDNGIICDIVNPGGMINATMPPVAFTLTAGSDIALMVRFPATSTAVTFREGRTYFTITRIK